MIQTTNEKANKAYLALEHITAQPFLLRDARNLMMLKNALKPEADFHNQESQKLFLRYSVQIKDGKVTFDTTEDRDEFDKRWAEMDELEVNLDMNPVVIRLGEYRGPTNVVISPNDLADLAGFVDVID